MRLARPTSGGCVLVDKMSSVSNRLSHSDVSWTCVNSFAISVTALANWDRGLEYGAISWRPLGGVAHVAALFRLEP